MKAGGCRKRRSGEITAHPDAILSKNASGIHTPNANATEEARFVEYFNHFVWPSASAIISDWTSGPGQVCFASTGPNKKTDLCVVVPAQRHGGRHRIAYYNYHSTYYHFREKHRPSCRLYKGPNDLWDNAARVSEEREAEDLAAKKRYAAAMTTDEVLVTYDVVDACQLFHGKFERPSRWNPDADDEAVEGFRSITELIRVKFPDDSLEGLSLGTFSQEKLIRNILDDDGKKYGGFVTVFGGEESETKSPAADAVGFCHGKVKINEDMIGPFTLRQMALEANRVGVEPKKFIRQKLRDKTPTTVTRDYHGRTETISVAFLRFLIEKRGFKNFSILHYIHYNERNYIASFIEDMLQRRHELRRQPGGGDPLMSLILKLIPNSFFGYNAIARNKFTRLRIVNASSLTEKGKRFKLKPKDQVTGVTLVGVVTKSARRKKLKKGSKRKAGKKTADLVYAVAYKRPSTKVINFAQVAAAILSNSRVIFFSLIDRLLNVLDWRKAALVYCDTDSCYLSLCKCSEAGWSAVLRPEHQEKPEEVLSDIFENKDSTVQQSGFLKNEGQSKERMSILTKTYFSTVTPAGEFRYILVRSAKAYYLGEKLDSIAVGGGSGGGGDKVAFKGVARKAHGSLRPDHFGQNVSKIAAVCNTTTMRPTASASEVVMRKETKSLGRPFNYKRRMIVRSFSVTRRPTVI